MNAISKRVGIVGNGYVGSAVNRFFSLRYETRIHDPKLIESASRWEINQCGLGVVCVPTPEGKDGACDTSIVEEVCEWLETPLILIHSTVSPGTTQRIMFESGKRIVFSPEYIGESAYYTAPEYPHPTDIEKHSFFIFGGDTEDTGECVDWFVPITGPQAFFYQVDATTAELIKYWENCWGGNEGDVRQ